MTSDPRDKLKLDLAIHLTKELITELRNISGIVTDTQFDIDSEFINEFVEAIPDIYINLNKQVLFNNKDQGQDNLFEKFTGQFSQQFNQMKPGEIIFKDLIYFSKLTEESDIESVQNHIRQIYKVFTGKEINLLKGILPEEVTDSVLSKLKELEDSEAMKSFDSSKIKEQASSISKLFDIDNSKESKIISGLIKEISDEFCLSLDNSGSLSKLLTDIINGNGDNEILNKFTSKLEKFSEDGDITESSLQTYSENLLQHFMKEMQGSGKTSELLAGLSGNPEISNLLSKFGMGGSGLANFLGSKDLQQAMKMMSEIDSKKSKSADILKNHKIQRKNKNRRRKR